MKVADIFESDEFENHENLNDDLEHLSRIQKARAHEYWMFLVYLNKKYHLNFDERLMATSQNSLARFVAVRTRHPSQFLPTISDEDTYKIDMKFKRLIRAKEAYERAGGEYDWV